MSNKTYVDLEREKLSHIASITKAVASSNEIRGVYRIVEETPAGPKCRFEERPVDDFPIDFLYGGVLLVCPRGDRTNGKRYLEISVRDSTIRVVDYNDELSKDQGVLDFSEPMDTQRLELNQNIRDTATRLQRILMGEGDYGFTVKF